MRNQTHGNMRNCINIRLRFLEVDGQWQHFEAQGWSGVGLHFYHVQEIHKPALELR